MSNKTTKKIVNDSIYGVCPICGESRAITHYDADSGCDVLDKILQCKCERERIEQFKREEHQHWLQLQIDANRQRAFRNPADGLVTFDLDDLRNPDATAKCKKYVAHKDEMLKRNIGAVCYGQNGTGKTELLRFTANGLIDSGASVLFTNLSELIRRISAASFADKEAVYREIEETDFLVIDDFGAERGTAYNTEQVFLIVDTRYRAKKPLLITTNLTPAMIKNPEDLEQKRIYDRIYEMCCGVDIKVTGSSRRPDIATKNREFFNNL